MMAGPRQGEGVRVPPPAATFPNRFGTMRASLLDTDYILNQVGDAVGGDVTTRLGIPGIYVRSYAAQHVYDELYRDDGHGHPTKWHKLSDQARQAGNPVRPSVFSDKFESRLLPHLTFVRMGGLFADHPLVQRVASARGGRGASDAPTAQLAVLLSRLRPVAYSHDEHLYKPGVAPRPWVFPAVCEAEARVAQGEHLYAGATGLTVGSVAGLDYLARRVGALVGAPIWGTRLLALAAGTWAMTSPDKRRAVGRVMGAMLVTLAEHHQGMVNGLEQLDRAVVNVDPSDSLESRIAEVLVRQADGGPLLARDIQEHLIVCDRTFVDVPTMTELRSVLDLSPCFEEGPRWRYGVGNRYEPAAARRLPRE